MKKKQTSINPFQPMFHFYTPLKTSENRRFSDVFREYRSGILVENVLNISYSVSVTIKNCHLLKVKNS